MIKFAGHTMGVPKLDIFESIDCFKSLGYDGIEVRVKEDGQIDDMSYNESFGKKIKSKLKETGIELCCLTPYYNDFVTKENKENHLSGFKRVIDVACDLGCGIVRSYGGILPPENIPFEECYEKTIKGIQECAEYARHKNVKIAIETHIGSMTFSAGEAVKMVKDVGKDNVGILFDYAWVNYIGKEGAEEAINMVKPYLLHCHVKDWTVQEKSKNQKRSCLMGDGELPWPFVLKSFLKINYDGYISDEYEKYWYPKLLPDAEIGMKQNLEYMKNILYGSS